MTTAIASIVFICGYLLITLESKLHINKSAFALAMGGILWMIVGIAEPSAVEGEMAHTAYDIFNIVVFLLAAMSLVEILVHYRIFDVIRAKITQYHITDRKQFLALGLLAFLFSAIIDNLTATIVMIQIARQFFQKENLFVAVVGIVIAANAGGAFSPLGDVTTIMLWLGDKFSALEVIVQGFLPSLALFVTVLALLLPKIKESGFDAPAEHVEPLSVSEKLVIGTVGVSFLLPILAKTVHLPPVLGILLGVGLTWIMVDLLKSVNSGHTHMTATIEHLIKKVDVASLKFFIGILLAVAALGSLGVLDHVSAFIYGEGASTARVIGGNIVIGAISSVLDNIPLTAIAMDILTVESASLWVLLALSVGTGGSFLALGSAAGVVAMGMVQGLTFEKYFKIGFVPAVTGFVVCMFVWGVQYFVF